MQQEQELVRQEQERHRVPVELRVGASDGRNSELLEGDLDEGDPLIVEEKAPLRRGRGAP